MREAARTAEVGDAARDEDPTVARLEARSAEILGMEAALFVPSGTMGNQIAIRTHANRGETILCERSAHVYRRELAASARLSGLQTVPLDGGDGAIPSREQVNDALNSGDSHCPSSGALCLENPHNSKGGIVVEPAEIDTVADAAHEVNVPVHLDGSRLFNAAVSLGVPAKRLTRNVDSTMFCLSKGLGSPVGSILAGSEAFVEKARETRQLFGGTMRQAGILAAPGLKALDDRTRLKSDHENAERLADGLSGIDGFDVSEPETNVVVVDTDCPAEAFLAECEKHGVLGTPCGDRQIRFATHIDVGREDIREAAELIRRARARYPEQSQPSD